MGKDKTTVSDLSETPLDPTFRKEQLLTFQRYRDRCDLLTALLQSDKAYTLHEVDALIDNFMKGTVN